MKWFKHKKEQRLIYAPKDDITAFELAQCLKLFSGALTPRKLFEFERFPKEVKRHFYVLEE